jgi:hypothetical protein
MWQISFAASPKVLEDLRQQLKLDERVLRHIVVKKAIFKPLPTTHSVKNQATELLKGETNFTYLQGQFHRRISGSSAIEKCTAY